MTVCELEEERVMNIELELKLQEEFPFMKQNPLEEEQNLYRRFG